MKSPLVAAVASSGGHWIQLLRLAPAWQGLEVFYVTTGEVARLDTGEEIIRVVDANRWQKLRLILMCLQVTVVMLRRRPGVVVTTGAAPGLAAIVAGRLIGARTLWVDSVANSEELSGSGRLARRLASQCLTQWEHLAQGTDPAYWGNVL